ncbi:MAG: hypothetical protein WBB34_04395 [Xanthobacteraceae bacterium]
MTGRPCKPGEDLKGLWRMLLPGTPFPVCGVSEPADAAAASATTPQERAPAKAADAAEAKSD